MEGLGNGERSARTSFPCAACPKAIKNGMPCIVQVGIEERLQRRFVLTTAASGSDTPMAHTLVPGLVLKAACSPGCCQLAEGETIDLLPSLNSRLTNAVGGADANPPVLDGFFTGLGIGASKELQRAQQKKLVDDVQLHQLKQECAHS
eukprot:gene6424-6655_t